MKFPLIRVEEVADCLHCGSQTNMRERYTGAPLCTPKERREFWNERGENPHELPQRPIEFLSPPTKKRVV